MDFFSRFLSRQAIEAAPDYNRWLVPPAALAIHLCIGQVYAFSVFRLPMTRLLGVSSSIEGDWKTTEIFWAFTLAIVFLGLSAAVFGRWVEKVGPRVSGLVSALLWSGGFFLSALGVHWHQLWLVCLGYGVVGGCGLGIGYITPVSTLIKWFPDKRGLATGLAIMGFGGGAMIAAPLSERLMTYFSSPDSVGVSETLLVLGSLFLPCMLVGALAFRLPSNSTNEISGVPGKLPKGFDANQAIQTRSFWLLWLVLFCNVTAGIGVLDVASKMIQEMFPDRMDAALAAGFVGLLSLFNLVGRLGWSGASDRLGRGRAYSFFLGLGMISYFLEPFLAGQGWLARFVVVMALIMSLYGGVFAAIPAYLSDVFGTANVGAIHGRLLTAWSCAGIAGPMLINYLHVHQLDQGIPRERSYDLALWTASGLLVVGLLANFGVKSLLVLEKKSACQLETAQILGKSFWVPIPRAGLIYLVASWSLVLLPLLWGVYFTLLKAVRLLGWW